MSARIETAMLLLNDAARESADPAALPIYASDSDALAAAQALVLVELVEQQRIANLIELVKLDETIVIEGETEVGDLLVSHESAGSSRYRLLRSSIRVGLGL